MPKTDLGGLSILIVEDEALLRNQIKARLDRLGADVTDVGALDPAKLLLHDLTFDVALLDVNLPDGLGTDLLKEKFFPAHTAVIVMTAQGNIAGAVDAIRTGAVDYLVKPFDPAELPLVISRVRRSRQAARAQEQRFEEALDREDSFFFGSSLQSVKAQMDRILEADRRLSGPLPPVLIQGETGTGKTTIARRLHHQGPRGAEPLVEVNCSTLPESLAESELFGHERGAFTDARTARMGLFEAASGGTLFLDELPSLSPPLQAKVLTVLEDHRIRRVGGNRQIAIDVRVITATERTSRPWWRRRVSRRSVSPVGPVPIEIPPLRDRGGDILEWRRSWFAVRVAATSCHRRNSQIRGG